MIKVVYIVLIAVALISCNSNEIQVVESFYENGQAKIVKIYEIHMGDSIPQMEFQYHKDGSILLEGVYTNGLREGEWISYFNNGNIWSKGYFSKGKRTGKGWIYYPNGKLRMKGSYKNGKKTGKWMVFDEEGTVIADDDF